MEYRSRCWMARLLAAGITALAFASATTPALGEGAFYHTAPAQKNDNRVEAISPAQRPVLGESSAVLNGTPTIRAPFTGMLFRREEGNKISLATGSLVCPNVVLTVAHFANVRPKEARFTMGRDALKHVGNAQVDAKVVDHFSLSDVPGTKEKLNDVEASLDIALMKLDTSIKDVTPAKISKELPIPKKNAFKIVGYGNNDKSGGGSGFRREGVLDVKYLSVDTEKGIMVHTPGPGGEVGMPGDSGAPVFKPTARGALGDIVGIHSTGNGTERNTTALLAPVRERLIEKLRDWCPAGTAPE